MKQTFSKEVREAVYSMSHGACQNPTCFARGEEYHHMLPNYQRYWLKYPLLIQSPFNCKLLCRECHMNKTHLFKIRESDAVVYEMYLRNLKLGLLS